jgi:hypothetical protein
MAKRLKIDDTSAQVKDFLRQLDVEKGEYVLEVEGKPLVGVVSPWQVEKLSQRGEEVVALLQQSWQQNRTVAQAEIKQAVKEAIEEVRGKKPRPDHEKKDSRQQRRCFSKAST